MLVSIIKISIIFVHTFIMSIVTTVVTVVTGSPVLFDKSVRTFYHGLLVLGGAKVKVIGAESLDLSRNYIYVANHSSYYDIPTVLTGIPDKRIRIMYKKEMQKIPVFGWAMKWTRFYIPINRGRGIEAQQSLDAAIQRIKDGDSVLLFPEGTRSNDGTLQPFKRGAFNIAIRAGVPVVPVTVIGSRRVLPKDSYRITGGTITMIIHQPIEPPAEEGKTAELELMQAARQVIEQQFTKQEDFLCQ